MDKKQLFSIVTSTLKELGFKHWCGNSIMKNISYWYPDVKDNTELRTSSEIVLTR
jgi:hypothetical protein